MSNTCTECGERIDGGQTCDHCGSPPDRYKHIVGSIYWDAKSIGASVSFLLAAVFAFLPRPTAFRWLGTVIPTDMAYQYQGLLESAFDLYPSLWIICLGVGVGAAITLDP